MPDAPLKILVYSDNARTREKVRSALGKRVHPDLPELSYLDVATAPVVVATLDGGGIDLAILKLDDDSFFDSHPPIPREKVLPGIKDAVMVYGYPTGGTTLSITKGIVSRIEFSLYHSSVSGLRSQIDAAINPGNSGGPAIVDGKMIGLAFSRLGDAENIGYIIPCEEIDLFLEDIKDGRYDGKPYDGTMCYTQARAGIVSRGGKDPLVVVTMSPLRLTGSP